jgi:hypothetical protein
MRAGTSEDAQAAGALAGAPLIALALSGKGHDDLVTYLESIASDFRDAPVGDTGGDLARRRFAIHQHVQRARRNRRGLIVSVLPAPIAISLALAAALACATGIRGSTRTCIRATRCCPLRARLSAG